MAAQKTTDKTTVFVCTTCRPPGDDTGVRPGVDLLARLEAAVAERGADEAIEIAGVECLSVCKRPATIAVSGSDKWTFLFGDIAEDTDILELVAGLQIYGATDNGIVPWKARPAVMKKVVGRVPPFPGARSAPDASVLKPALETETEG
ncbi:MAG: DUF1636 domain-containing protein [Pseudomonadota bacterium]